MQNKNKLLIELITEIKRMCLQDLVGKLSCLDYVLKEQWVT